MRENEKAGSKGSPGYPGILGRGEEVCLTDQGRQSQDRDGSQKRRQHLPLYEDKVTEVNMRAEEIALRQEIRQMMAEAGLNRNTIRETAAQVLKEEVVKQAQNALKQANIDSMVRSQMQTYEFRGMLQNAVRKEVQDVIKISVEVKAEIPDESREEVPDGIKRRDVF